MHLFPLSFFSLLILGALALTGAGAVALVLLLVRDAIRGKVW